MIRKPKQTAQTLTGQIEPITFKQLETRVNSIRYRAKTPSHSRTIERFNNTGTSFSRAEGMTSLNSDIQTDQMQTKFRQLNREAPQQTSDKKSIKNVRNRIMSLQRSFQLKRDVNEEKGTQKTFVRTVKQQKVKKMRPNKVEGQDQQGIYRKQIYQFQTLYESLGNILGSIKQNLTKVEESIKLYLDYIQTKKLSFIDDFIQGRQRKLQKVVRQARLQQSLSVAYLFLQLAQSRMENNESYLTNFLGFCLSNVLLTTRIYILKQAHSKYLVGQFQEAMKCVEIGSFGKELTSQKDVLLRLQHNNQIITMMQKKLGRFNPKFQSCIQMFFKQAQRKKTSCVQCTHYIFQYLSLHIHEADLVGISTSLQVAPVPYCPPPQKQYTLIIEPLGILLSEGRTRPYLFQFLEWAAKHFQIIFWTWEMPYEAEIQAFIQKLQYYLTAKLYRYHCLSIDDIWVKDLDRLGRTTDRTVIVDYDKRIFQRHPHNGIQLRWKQVGTVKDKGLLLLCQILQQMISTESLVTDTLKIYAEQLHQIRGV